MYIGKFDIDFICIIPKHGYIWKDNKVDLIPKKNTGVIKKPYTQKALDDFRRLVNKTPKSKNFKINMLKTLEFSNEWGNPFSSSENDIKISAPFHAQLLFSYAITFYRKLLKNIQDEVIPKNPNKFIPPMDNNITFDWDRFGDKMLPVYKPNCLWDAIRFTILFSGIDAKETSKVCARELCGNSFSGRSNKIYCSEYCTKQAWADKNRPRKANSERR
tara:strand:+ start:674 stop:1324 length:651 start_codon:yes stop_codon:yes gene_type:complete